MLAGFAYVSEIEEGVRGQTVQYKNTRHDFPWARTASCFWQTLVKMV